MEHKRSSTKFYQEDIVRRIEATDKCGVIFRCWHDAEDPPPQGSITDPMMRPLQRGEVGISFFPSGHRDISHESDFTLVDRTFQSGDYCKRSITDVRSGVVTGVDVRGRLAHAISGVSLEGWVSKDDCEIRMEAEIGDYVAYNDWIGQVIELFDESIVEIQGGQLVCLPELSSRLSVGEKGGDILPPIGGMQSLFGFLIGNNRPNNVDTVVAVKHTVLAIVWLAINQALDPADAESRKRPPRFWFGHNFSNLTMVRSRYDQQMRVGDKVHLRNSGNLPTTTHGREGEPAGQIVVDALVVTETCTMVNVLWQDGTHETVRATELIPYLNPDESDCWPGDHVVWKSENEKGMAVVQSVNSVDRTASILCVDTGMIELVSLLELDPHGTSDFTVADPHLTNGLGVRRGDHVFVHREGTTNGLEKPRVPRIGEVESWVRESPIQQDGQLAGWRSAMSALGTDIAKRGEAGHVEDGCITRVAKESGCLSWFGEVTGLRLDGTVNITHPDFSRAVYPLEQLTKLYDGIEQLEDGMWDEISDFQGASDSSQDESSQVWLLGEDGTWQSQDISDEGDEWEEMDDSEDLMDTGWNFEPALALEDGSSPDIPRATAAAGTSPLMAASSQTSRPPSPDLTKVPTPIVTDDDAGNDETHPDNALLWKRFDVLSSAPHDHAFYSSPPALMSKSFLVRLTREYRVLASSLPESIIVRAYEDRTDLLRSLIIGPENTPYEDAPFVIDWMLDANFPNSPPIAHFLSWTNGNGRVNPNLYEDGKVCLSILGTWAGDKNESWSAARSSLLQAFVSIQGLVLVKEPWFCEPAYEKLRSTEEGIVNSRLYNEKAYVLSRGFVRRALEIPLGGLESEINWMYYRNKRLEKIILDASVLIENSKTPSDQSDAESELAVPRLSVGGRITLGRTLTKLHGLLDTEREKL